MVEANTEEALQNLVAAFAGPEAMPAGGAAAVTAIAMGVGLGIKVIHLSSPSQPDLVQSRRRLEGILEILPPEFSADCSAFSALLEALRRPRTDAAREAEVARSWRGATEAPVAVALMARESEALLVGCVGNVKPSVNADLKAALELVRAGQRIAEENARENARHLSPQLARQLLARIDQELRE